MYTFDHSELEARLRYIGITKELFAHKMGITRSALDNFLKGKSHWTDSQLKQASIIVKCKDAKDFDKLFLCVKN